MIETAPGRWVQQTDEQAWDDARALVRHYVFCDYPVPVICRLMNPPISETTLRKYFPKELEDGVLIQNARIAGTAYRMAVSGRDPGMTRYMLRVKMGWVEKNHNTNGAPIVMQSIPGDDGL